jgi:DNA gyrase subunit A
MPRPEHIYWKRLLKALDVIDEVIETIKKSESTDLAKTNLMSKFGFRTPISSYSRNAAKKLAHLERNKLQTEYDDLMKRVSFLISVLKDPKEYFKLSKTKSNLCQKFTATLARQSLQNAVGEFSEEDLI